MARKVVDLTIRLKDGVSGTLAKIKGGITGLKSGIAQLAKVGAIGFGALSAGAIALGAAVKKAFNFETAKMQLNILLGSIDAANKRFNELKEFSAKTPFQLPDILKASRLLSVFSENVMGGAESLKLVGDAAASVNQNIGDVAFWFGRAYSLINAGKPFGEAALRLQEMGILTAKGTIRIQELQDAGASSEKIFASLKKEFDRFNGGMVALSKTGNGLISTLKDNWTIAVATFGEAFMDAAKGGMTQMIDTLQRLVKDGTITAWAEQAKAALEATAETIKIITKGGEGRSAVLGAVGDVIKQAFKSAAITAVEVLAKYAPIIGKSMAQGVMDLLGLDSKAVAGGKRAARDAQKAYEFEAVHGTKGSQDATYKLWMQAENNLRDIVNEQNKINIDSPADLKGALSNLEKVIQEYSKDGVTPGGKKLADTLAKAVEEGAKKGTETGAKKGAAKGVAEGAKEVAIMTPQNLSMGLDGKSAEGSKKLIQTLMRGQEGLSRRESLGVLRELIKSGGSGQLEEASKLYKDLTRGDDALSGGDALAVVRELIKGGALADGGEIRDLLKTMLQGDDSLSRKDASRALMHLFGGGDPDALGGATVARPPKKEATMTNELLKEIANNTKGGLF